MDIENSINSNKFTRNDDRTAHPPILPFELSQFTLLNVEDLHKIIKLLPNKNFPLNPLPNWLQKECVVELTQILLFISNSSIQEANFAQTLKFALVSPVIKKIFRVILII